MYYGKGNRRFNLTYQSWNIFHDAILVPLRDPHSLEDLLDTGEHLRPHPVPGDEGGGAPVLRPDSGAERGHIRGQQPPAISNSNEGTRKVQYVDTTNTLKEI